MDGDEVEGGDACFWEGGAGMGMEMVGGGGEGLDESMSKAATHIACWET